MTRLPSGETTIPITPSGRAGLTSPVSNASMYMRVELPSLLMNIICFPSPKNVGYEISSVIGGYRLGSPELVGSKTSCGGKLPVVTSTHFLSGDIDHGRPSPRRTAGVPRM